MAILMCKNSPVYNIDTEEIYNKNLLPGYMIVHGANKYTFKAWLKLRYSSNTNTIARQLKGIAFGQGNRVSINKDTFALSLSDSYWLKDRDDTIKFEAVSPYYQEFWKGKGEYTAGISIPTLYVGGYLRKEWVNGNTLIKYGEETRIEESCVQLCHLCAIPANNIVKIKGGMAFENFTSPDVMLEQADESGRLDPDDFDENTIERLFGLAGIRMLIIDAITGNGDRHAGNFGWLRDTNTGAYISMAPLYDFDHALDSKSQSDRLITDTMKVVKEKQEYIEEALRISNITINSNINSIFTLRAKTICSLLEI